MGGWSPPCGFTAATPRYRSVQQSRPQRPNLGILDKKVIGENIWAGQEHRHRSPTALGESHSSVRPGQAAQLLSASVSHLCNGHKTRFARTPTLETIRDAGLKQTGPPKHQLLGLAGKQGYMKSDYGIRSQGRGRHPWKGQGDRGGGVWGTGVPYFLTWELLR